MARGVDVLVVGARCAGSPLSMILARAGKRVVAIDADELPSDQPMSTHFIGVYGMKVLDELGLGDEVRAIAPPVTRFVNGIEDVRAIIEFPAGRAGSCPRRTDLDALLVDHARKAGAEIRPRTKLVDLLREDGRVVGAVVEHEGKREEIRASVVVGADGRHSKVASLVGTKEYRAYDTPRAAYWAYWKRPTWYADDPRYRGAAAIIHDGDDYFVVFPTNTDQLLVGVVVPVANVADFTGRSREKLLERLRAFDFTRPLVQEEPLSKVVSMIKGRFFFREAAGPGWALVGDAGLFKDPAPGLGISDAFRDARALAAAVLEGTDEALVRYWRERDVASLELYEFAKDLGMPGYNNPLNRAAFAQMRERVELRDAIVAIHERRISPFAAFTTGEIVRWTAREVLRGRVGALRAFFRGGKRAADVKETLASWKALAAEARAAAEAASAVSRSARAPDATRAA